MAQPAPLALGYNIDALAAGPGSLLIAGLSNFVGPRWTGALGVVAAPAPAAAAGGGGGAPRLVQTFQLHKGVPAVALLASQDEFTGRRLVAAGGDDGSLELFYLSAAASGAAAPDSQPLQPAAQARALHDGAMAALAPAPAGAELASASGDGTLRLWDCSNLLTCTSTLGAPGGPALSAAAWLGERQLVAAGADGRLCLWDARQLGAAPAAAAAVGAPALSLAAVGQGSQPLLVVGDQLGRLAVFDPRALASPLQQRQLHGDAVCALAASSSSGGGGGGGGSGSGSGLVASGGDDGAVLLLDCADLAASRQLAPARRDGEAPLYVRALAWGEGGQLWRGGWDQSLQALPL